MCGTICFGIVGRECVPFVGEYVVGLWRMSFCCVRESLMWVWGSEFVLCVEEFDRGLEIECVLCVGHIVVGLGK